MAAPRVKRFGYYARLSPELKLVYRASDAVGEVELCRPEALAVLVAPLRAALASGERADVQRAAGKLCKALLVDLGVPPVDLEVLEARPRGDYGELHGLYTYDLPDKPRIQVWMKTAAKAKPVAWKSFLRTLLHEIGHHLDFHLLKLADSLHTQGFYRRETSLFDQLVPDGGDAPLPPQLGLPGLE